MHSEAAEAALLGVAVLLPLQVSGADEQVEQQGQRLGVGLQLGGQPGEVARSLGQRVETGPGAARR
ncbi:hypothetical protein [Nonomuraea dietziae]|uniref:hypothetical protein n=1 Tax=Nonomuraea dietziae TaxID=65515 RepID=UPI0031DCACCA